MHYQVDLCVYDITDLNNFLYPIGLGAYHTCIHVINKEFSYGSKYFDKRHIFRIIRSSNYE